jgi:hypothetical protein
MKKEIDLWFTNKNGQRESISYKSLKQALKHLIEIYPEGIVDVLFFDNEGEVIESKTEHYRLKEGLVKKL